VKFLRKMQPEKLPIPQVPKIKTARPVTDAIPSPSLAVESLHGTRLSSRKGETKAHTSAIADYTHSRCGRVYNELNLRIAAISA
jgi:hypothetical protein